MQFAKSQVFKMSQKNRHNEYKRLISLGRVKDIDPALIQEFGKVPGQKPTPLKDVDKPQAPTPNNEVKK